MGARQLSLGEAAEVLGLTVEGVEALVGAGYLGRSGQALDYSEIKSFQARNAPGSGETVDDVFAEVTAPQTGAEAIVEALVHSVDEMARRAADIVTTVFPDAARWTPEQRGAFERQARARFEAILAVTTRGAGADEDLYDDLADAGGAAAFAGASLPQVLLTLRVSRDLMVQTAVAAAEDRGRHWGLALAVVLTRVLPVLDRLVDAVARGYWQAVLTREQESFARYEHVVEHSASGVYEVDLDGLVTYANPVMAVYCGHDRHDLDGLSLVEVLVPQGSGTLQDVFHTPTVSGWREVRVRRPDGVERVLSLQVSERTYEGSVVGYDGIVRDITAERELEAQKNEFLALITHELRQPLTTILGLGVTLETYAADLSVERLTHMGRSIHTQCERIARLADDLYDVSRIQSNLLTLTLRPVALADAVGAALRMVPGSERVAVDLEDGLVAMADGRRLELVLAHLVENALQHGAPPVRVLARASDDVVAVVVADAGPGVPPDLVDGLFATLRPSVATGAARLVDRPSGLGLPLARSLVEAMGGRISHVRADDRTLFRVQLPRP